MKSGILSTSTQKNFRLNNYKKRMEEQNKLNDQNVQDMLLWYERADARKLELEKDPTWKKNNLEYDLRSTEWILEKVRNSEVYAQNLYAALCNNEFLHNDMWDILKDEKWSCTWRYAGGIIADMKQEGDYVSWYCSGIRGERLDENSQEYKKLTDEQKYFQELIKQYVSESVVTDEIRNDLKKLGWGVVPYDEGDI